MVEGVVNDQLEPVVILSVMGPSGHAREIEAVIDTGLNGFLFLPTDVVLGLNLEFIYNSPVELADGTMGRSGIYSATVIWDGEERSVQAIASTGMSLVGMRMLEDHDLHVQVRNGGNVLIESPV